jgi:hypothetical protein
MADERHLLVTGANSGFGLHGLVDDAGCGVTGAIEDVPDDEARAVLEILPSAESL